MQASPLSLFLTSLLFLFCLSASAIKNCNRNDEKVLLAIKADLNDKDELSFTDWDPKTSRCCTWSGVSCNAANRVTSLTLLLTADTPKTIPPVVGNLSYLESLKIGQFGKLSGYIPGSIWTLKNLQTLDLGGNSLTGPVSEFVYLLKNLKHLDLSNNAFDGTVPNELGTLTELTYVDLSLNKLRGPIPNSLGQAKNLAYLDLASNRLVGPIPPTLSQLTKLTRLDLRANMLTGSIPASFGSFKNPELDIYLSQNQLSGPIPRAVGKYNVSSLDLSMNKFTGDASFLFKRDKTTMTTIYLNNNKFFFDLSYVSFPLGLRNLDIADNRIYGGIPKQLGQLPLTFLRMSNNLLCGPIPTGRKLKRFSPDVFAHNKCLCGPPLPPCKH